MLRWSLGFAVLAAIPAQALTPMPDAALRNWANGLFPGCIVGTSIDETHPGVVAATDLWLVTPGIQDLTGLSAFVNVTMMQIHGQDLGMVNELPPQIANLTIMNSQFTEIISSPTLYYLGIRSNQLTSVQLGFYPQLANLSCADNQLTTLDLSSCPQLTWLNCSNNELTSITGYGAFLSYIDASHNLLGSLSVPNYCTFLDISYNLFTAVPTANPSGSRTVIAHHNQISTFWGGGTTFVNVDLSHNQLTGLPILGSGLRTLDVGNNPLTTIAYLPVELRVLRMDSTPMACLPYLNRDLEELYTQGTALTCIPNQPLDLLMSAANFGFAPAVCGSSDPCYIAQPSIAMKVFLQGPFNYSTHLMNDNLRVQGLLPATEPYTALGFAYAGEGWHDTFDPAVLTVSGNDAIVDWVVVDMRPDPVASSQGNAVHFSRPALVQRDGDVVGLDGSWPLVLNMNQGRYVAAIRHRNHLGAVERFGTLYTDGTLVKDFTNWTTMACWPGTMHGDSLQDPNRQLWSGDVNFDHVLRYMGANNDRDPILNAIGGSTPTAVEQSVYAAEDVNMDGTIKYLGGNNDRDPILQNIGGSTPTATRSQIGFQ